MVDLSKAIEPDFRSIRISIIDILGVFLPGLIWTDLLVTVGFLLSKPADVGLSPVGIGLRLTAGQPASRYVALALGALLTGFVVKPFATRVPEFFCSLDAYWKPGRRRDHRFPYDAEFHNQPCFKQVTAIITSQLGCTPQELPAWGAFSAAR